LALRSLHLPPLDLTKTLERGFAYRLIHLQLVPNDLVGCLIRSGFTLYDLVLRATKVRAGHIDTHLLLSVIISRTPVLGESSENIDTTKTDGDLVVSELLVPLQCEILLSRIYFVCVFLNLVGMFVEFLLMRVLG